MSFSLKFGLTLLQSSVDFVSTHKHASRKCTHAAMWLSTKLFGLKEYILEMYTAMRRIISLPKYR